MTHTRGEERNLPDLTPEGIKVFIAHSDPATVETITASLEGYELDHTVEVASSFEAADAYIREQSPGELTSNVFLLGARVVNSEGREDRFQGLILSQRLADQFESPLEKAAKIAVARMRHEVGISSKLTRGLIPEGSLRVVATRQLRSQALVVGMGWDCLRGSAQLVVNDSNYDSTGRLVYESAITEATRNRIAKQKVKEEQRGRAARLAQYRERLRQSALEEDEEDRIAAGE